VTAHTLRHLSVAELIDRAGHGQTRAAQIAAGERPRYETMPDGHQVDLLAAVLASTVASLNAAHRKCRGSRS
jgi:hypothetical protein